MLKLEGDGLCFGNVMDRTNWDMASRHAKRDEGVTARIKRVSMACSRRNPRFENVGKMIMTMNDRARRGACHQSKPHRYCLQITSWFVIRAYRRASDDPSISIHDIYTPINKRTQTHTDAHSTMIGDRPIWMPLSFDSQACNCQSSSLDSDLFKFRVVLWLATIVPFAFSVQEAPLH